MSDKNMPDLKVGSRVFVYACGALRMYEITGFRIIDGTDGMHGQVDTVAISASPNRTESPHTFSLDLFIKGINAAMDMKIKDIDW